MRVLNIISTLDPRFGGPAEAVKQLCVGLQSAGHTAEVACMDAPHEEWLENSVVKVHALGPYKGPYAYNPRIYEWLLGVGASFDCFVIHGLWQYHSVVGRRAAVKLRMPYYVFPHGMLSPWFRNEYPLKHLKKVLYWSLVERRTIRDAAGTLFTCEEECTGARETFPFYSARERVVTLGVDVPRKLKEAALTGGPSKERELSSQGMRVLFLGRLHPVKGCDMLIRALALVGALSNEFTLLIAGPDPLSLTSTLESEAERLGVADRIQWLGPVMGEAKWQLVESCDALILPSHHENFGMVVVEALACAKPVLLSKRVNIWREVCRANAGIAESDTEEGIALLLRRWLSLSNEERRQMGIDARRCYEECFTSARATTVFLEAIGWR